METTDQEHAESNKNAPENYDGMPDKRLAFESAVNNVVAVDEEGHPERVVIIERWGKGKKVRARTRVLKKENRGYPGSGITYTHHGAAVVDGDVYWVIEQSGADNWWLESIDWGEKPVESDLNTE